MCGIAGIIGSDGQAMLKSRLERMTGVLAHRGPDGEGHWYSDDQRVALGHRRLAVIDLSEAAAQPMHLLDRFTITLNGEIYNYPELRDKLEKKGFHFRTASDTEVLLAMYAAYGEACLSHLDGMFAFAIYDRAEKRLFCARDRFGEKPFFYCLPEAGALMFASEVKALFAAGQPFRENMRLVFYYLAYGVVENPFDKSETFFEGVFSLPPAHCLSFDSNGILSVKPWWRLECHQPDPDITPEAAASRIRELLTLSVKRRLRADVPVGSSLSGGIDSSAIVSVIDAHLGKGSERQSSFSARFDDPARDEGRYISLLTKKLGIKSYDTWVNVDCFTRDLDKMVWYQEEPMGGPSPVAQWEVMKLAASQKVTVLLDGQGADEVFAGYLHYFRPFLTECYRRDKRQYREEKKEFLIHHPDVFQPGMKFLLEAEIPGLLRSFGRIRRRLTTPDYLRDLHPDFAKTYGELLPPFASFHTLNETLHYATTVYGLGKLLKLADRNAMAFAREVRLPFLFHELVEYVFTLPASFKLHQGWSKWILRRATEEILPPEICWRPDKLGYEPPSEKWLASPQVRDMISDACRGLEGMHILKKPDARKDWHYWNLYIFLTVFKNQIHAIQ
ncbi:MAG TPA: asparagine synthase (glutamine-hydrolyzing) [Bacteroidales bacterium]|nr:asparagine synthase (glutamine-hydrolyzing) [Bacteroidales bacterium]HSA43486.1 asparagine synthase (glutamine-hydrolyzing) [Bacteroidales bacterium]